MGYRRRHFTIFDLPPIKEFERKHKKLSLAVLVVLLLCMGAYRYMKYQEKQQIIKDSTAQTVGVITEVKTSYSRRHHSRTTHSAVVEFEVDGKKYTARTASTTSIPHKGGERTVHYDPSDPSRNYIETSSDTAGDTGLLIAAGLVVLLIVIVAVDSLLKRGGGKPLEAVPENTYEQPNYDDIFK